MDGNGISRSPRGIMSMAECAAFLEEAGVQKPGEWLAFADDKPMEKSDASRFAKGLTAVWKTRGVYPPLEILRRRVDGKAGLRIAHLMATFGVPPLPETYELKDIQGRTPVHTFVSCGYPPLPDPEAMELLDGRGFMVRSYALSSGLWLPGSMRDLALPGSGTASIGEMIYASLIRGGAERTYGHEKRWQIFPWFGDFLKRLSDGDFLKAMAPLLKIISSKDPIESGRGLAFGLLLHLLANRGCVPAEENRFLEGIGSGRHVEEAALEWIYRISGKDEGGTIVPEPSDLVLLARFMLAAPDKTAEAMKNKAKELGTDRTLDLLSLCRDEAVKSGMRSAIVLEDRGFF